MYHKRDRFGQLKQPSVAYANYRHGRIMGVFPANLTWERSNERYRKRLRKKKIAKRSRRNNRR